MYRDRIQDFTNTSTYPECRDNECRLYIYINKKYSLFSTDHHLSKFWKREDCTGYTWLLEDFIRRYSKFWSFSKFDLLKGPFYFPN